MPEPTPNWVHLDLKGVIPAADELLRWVDYLADCGFNGIVWEYEDRLPWRSWPGTFRPGYDRDTWRTIWDRCTRRSLEIVPLIQTHGHLEWALDHDRWASWCEAGHVNEVCPQHPDVLPHLMRWIDEVIELHPRSRYLHIGADEAWHLASCPKCQAKAAGSPNGRLGVYVDHIARLCEHVIARGVRPMIWADMFWREARLDLAAALPAQTVLVDWHYDGSRPSPHLDALSRSGRELWGASAIRSSYEPKYALGMLGPHLANIAEWQRQLAAGKVRGLMHTFWCRSGSLGAPYGPWEGWLPGFIAAGNPQRWQQCPLAQHIPALDRALSDPEWVSPNAAIAQFEAIPCCDDFESAAARWWGLALRHRATIESVFTWVAAAAAQRARRPYRPVDPDRVAQLETRRRRVVEQLDAWNREARAFFADRKLSDVDEYLASKSENLRALLSD